MRKLILLVLLFPLFAIAQETGIHFEQGMSWEQIKEKAKAENKYIFMVCHVTWCANCRLMNEKIFPLKVLGDFMNDKFISVKVQFNITKEDNEEVKSWYKDRKSIKKMYPIKWLPTFLFFDPNANLVHRADNTISAKAIITIATNALNPKTQYFTLLNQYKTGQRDTALLSKLTIASIEANQNVEFLKISDKNQMESNIYTIDNIGYLSNNTTRTSDKGFRIMMEHPDKVDSLVGNNFAEITVAKIIVSKEVAKIRPKLNYSKPGWSIMSGVIERNYPTLSPKTIELAKLCWYEQTKDWTNYQIVVMDYIKQNRPNIPINQLNNYAFAIFLHSDDKLCLNEALGWSDQCCKSNDTSIVEDLSIYLDTYANLLYKLGQKEEALSWEQKAIDGAMKKEKINYLLVFNKMEMGDKTWE